MPPKRSATASNSADKKDSPGKKAKGGTSASNAANSFVRGGFALSNQFVGWMTEDQAGRKATPGFLLRRQEVFKKILSLSLSNFYSVATNKDAESQITIDIRGEKIAHTFTCDHGATFIKKEPYNFTCVFSTNAKCKRSKLQEGRSKAAGV